MHSDLKHLVNLFKGVRDVRETLKTYCLAPDMATTEMPDLVMAFEQTYGVKIKRYKVPDLKDELLRGMYLRYGDKVFIYLDSNLTAEWERYITIKEMCHLILGDTEYMTDEPTSLIELMIYEESGAPKDGDAPLDLVSDMWAKYAAHEMLFPHEFRAGAKESLVADPSSMFTLAQAYKVPEHVIEWALGDRYMQACNEAWDAISK